MSDWSIITKPQTICSTMLNSRFPFTLQVYKSIFSSDLLEARHMRGHRVRDQSEGGVRGCVRDRLQAHPGQEGEDRDQAAVRRQAQQDLRRGVQPRTQGPVQSRHGEKVKLCQLKL